MAKREKLYPNTIAFPASKSAGAIDITSDVMTDFGTGSLSNVEFEFSAANPALLTAGTINYQPYVSFDKGTSWIKGTTGIDASCPYTELIGAGGSTSGTAEVSTVILTGATLPPYVDKWFVLYDGATPYMIWFDTTGTATRPVTGVPTAFANAAGIKTSLVGGTTLDTIGQAGAASLLANATFNVLFTGTWLTNTFTFTNKVRKTCNDINAGNLLVATSVATSAVVTASGVDAWYTKQLALAPYLKVTAVCNAASALTSGHGFNFKTKMREIEDGGLRKKIFPNVLSGILDSTTTKLANSWTEYVSPVLTTEALDPWKRAYIVTSATDASKITNTFNVILQSSDDGIVWHLSSAVLTLAYAASGPLFLVTEVIHAGSSLYLGKYQRVRIYPNNTICALTSGHGIQVNMVAVY